MNKEYEEAVEIVRREAIRHRYLVKSICAAYLGCEVDDVVLRCKKKYGGNNAEDQARKAPAAGFNEADG